MTTKALVTSDLKKRFGRRWVHNGLSFAAKSGALTLIAGRNGAGKTTWMRLATGLAQPDSGSIRFAGASIEQVRSQLAVVFDEAAVYPHLSGAENLHILSGGQSIHVPDGREIVEALQLKPLLAQKAGSYSFGQKKRLALGAALLRRPAWLLLDEPSVGLDPVGWSQVRRTLLNLADRGATIVLTGQDLQLLEDLVDYVVMMKEGITAFAGSLCELQGRQPPRVRVRTSQPEPLLAAFPEAMVAGSRSGPCWDIPCMSRSEAEAVMERVRCLQIPFQLLEVKSNTLEEAFRQFESDFSCQHKG